jgi:hypothetical protein
VTRIKLGSARDKAVSETFIQSEGGQSSIKVGGPRDQALSTVEIKDLNPSGGNKVRYTAKDKSVLIKGGFYLLSLLLFVGCFVLLLGKVTLPTLLIIIAASLICLYLLALVLLPKSDISSKGFIQLMTQLIKVATRQ